MTAKNVRLRDLFGRSSCVRPERPRRRGAFARWGARHGVLALALLGVGCGARTGLVGQSSAQGDAGSDVSTVDVAVGCMSDDECATGDLCSPAACVSGECQSVDPVDCDDADECTEDSCEPTTGECVHRALSLDEDGDGFNGPRPGFAAGEPGSCGDDCDDTSAAAFPGGTEICDGVDNDCNGVIDDNSRFVPDGADAVRVSSDLFQANRGGLAWNETFYASTYGGRPSETSDQANFFKGLNPDGTTFPSLPEQPVTVVTGDSFTGPIVWTGSFFGLAWEDRRDGNWEIYFNRLDQDANKLGPDLRVSDTFAFSLGASMIWNGAEFVVAWQDDSDSPGQYRILSRRIGPDGVLLGDEVGITPLGMNSEAVSVVEGETLLGFSFSTNDGIAQQIAFRSATADLADRGDIVLVTSNGGRFPSMVWNRDRFVIAWEQGTPTGGPGQSILGAAISEDGAILVNERALATSSTFARTHSLIPLGDRLLLIWGDDRSGNFELYSKMLTPDLQELTPDARVTNAPGASVWPFAAFGPDGDVGVLFEDQRDGLNEIFFTRLVCQAGS